MPKLISEPTTIQPAGNMPKIIQEFIGAVNSKHRNISIAKMTSPAGWTEPFQKPEFDEFTFVLKGALHVECNDEKIIVTPGQVIEVKAGERIRYSTPEEGTEYIAICLPAFSPDTVHREE